MFVDEVIVKLIAGKGGDGCTSFRREKFVEMGGPNGGNGGKGADIIFTTDKSLKTLIDLKVQKIVKADKGVNGKGRDQNGANAEDVIIKVPEGTVVTNLETNEVICDLISGTKIIAHGGRGGRGNRSLATHDNPAPRMSELGAPGEELLVKCELKVLADVGLVGFPSAGKSTLLSVITNASPKIAAYHFTTLSPNLGVVKTYGKEFIIADLPGLIEGASEGVGLGFKFLKHAMRTKVIAHIIDMSGENSFSPLESYETIYNELAKYDESLIKKPSVVIASKMDLPESKENLAKFKEKYPNLEVYPISSVYNEGLDALIKRLGEIVEESDNQAPSITTTEKIYKYEEEVPFEIHRENNIWVLTGPKIEELFKMTRFTEDESVMHFAYKLKKMGVDEKLEELGAKRGDEVKIMDYIFNFKE
ncbi:MAG: GTPase ObgE [Tenericutes bacterium]|nr:GTPase ObgE [Mycoplasmatota bacterium]